MREIKHIVDDMPGMGYIIGLDMQHTYMEQDADDAAEYLCNTNKNTQEL